MSRAFVKEDSQQEPLRVPPRPALPKDATNYVTPDGLKQLHKEMEELLAEKEDLSLDDEDEQRRRLNYINSKQSQLQDRIDTSRVIEPSEQPPNEVRFGAVVKLEMTDIDKINQFQIVGVDQADFKNHEISFLSPIAQAITGHKVGDTVDLKLGKETRNFKILQISYQSKS